MPPPQMVHLVRFVRGAADTGYLACRIENNPTRTVGFASGGGGDVTITLKREDYLALDEGDTPIGLPLAGDVRAEIAFGFDPGEVIQLGGYWVRHVAPQRFGVPLGGNPETDAAFREYAVTLSLLPSRWADGRGGYLWNTVRNPATPDGLAPPVGDPLRVENSALLAILDGYLPLPIATPIPSTVDAFDPPAAIDWSVGRPVQEIQSLLARIGHAPVLSQTGEEIEIVRLAIAGEPIELPDPFPSGAEPYELVEHVGVRAKRVIVTSGRTRSTILTARDVSSLEPVWFDDRTGRWLNDADTLALYPTETQPGDIDALREGPGANGRPPEEFNRVLRCFRVPSSMLPRIGAIVAINTPVEVAIPGGEDTLELGSSPAAAFGDFAQPSGGGAGQFSQRNAASISGVRVDAVNRVFVFPFPMVKLDAAQGSLSDLVEIEAGDIFVVFAHDIDESPSFPATNYYMRLFSAEVVEGELDVTMSDDEVVITGALLDPEVVIVEAPFLRRVGSDLPGPAIAWLNDEELDAAALSLAKARITAGAARTGVITFAGFRGFYPGDWGGAVTSVTWDLPRASTTVSINQHEVALSALDQAEAIAGRSLAAGLSRFTLPGASAAMSDVRGGSTPGASSAPGAALGNGSASLDPASNSGGRGAGATLAAPPTIGAPTPEDARFEPGVFLAKITGATSIATNRWKYTWIEASITAAGGFADAASGGRSSATHGHAINLAEGMNTGAGVEGNGVNRDNLPATFSMQAVPTGRHVFMRGPFGVPGAPVGERWCAFDMSNADDGPCPEPME